MINVIRYNDLGYADHGWLKARHHFSFARYYDPNRMGFGALRVINDDIIAAGAGFDTHPHADMEIITYVRKGAISHRDSQGNKGRTEAGDVQVMSAGTGVYHSEFNLESEDTKLYQIWIEPNKRGIAPRWAAHTFPKEAKNTLTLLVSGPDEDAPLHIQQDARIYAGRLEADTEIQHAIKHQAYVLVSEGEITLNDTPLKAGDGAEVTDLKTLKIHATTEADVLVIDVPTHATPQPKKGK